MIKILVVILTMFAFGAGQTVDSIQSKSPRKAALYALLFPGGGQIYNGKYIKAGFLLGFEILAILRFLENRKQYRNYDEDLPLSQSRYLAKRNKYAWWIAFIYVYGLIDTIVDAHLSRFESIMSEDLERTETDEETKQETMP